jgi:WW domain-containing oxidoreductase
MTAYCACHENTEELAGKYFSHCKPVHSTKEANNLEAARKLWEVSEEWMKGLSSSTVQTPTTNENAAAIE